MIGLGCTHDESAPKRGRIARRVVVGLLLASPSASAHFALQSPAAWMPQDSLGSPQKLGPCGDEGNGTPTGTVTTFGQGETITITIKETVFHPGHYRVALAVDSREQLPAEPKVTADTTPCGSVPIQSPPVFPVLADGALRHSSAFSGPQTIQVTLPTNVTCTHCTLQVIEFMSNHGLNNPGGCFYHHCADIAIQPSGGGASATGGTTSAGGSSAGASGGLSAATAGRTGLASGGRMDGSGGFVTGGRQQSANGGAVSSGGAFAFTGGRTATVNGGTSATVSGGTSATVSGGSLGLGDTGGSALQTGGVAADATGGTSAEHANGGSLQFTSTGAGGAAQNTAPLGSGGAPVESTRATDEQQPTGCSCSVPGSHGRAFHVRVVLGLLAGIMLLRARTKARRASRKDRRSQRVAGACPARRSGLFA
jgi:hypothetical protein